jgi:Nucleotidyl transferase AbiEii toxin, Type IV TA system
MNLHRRQPNDHDLVILTQALSAFGVEYALIGGTAMAVHGFSRATKDIDLLLPVDAHNNAQLIAALSSIAGHAKALEALRREWMDKGHSTALEGEIFIDLLYVAASQTFESLKSHIQTVMFTGVPVVTLDVDGLLLTKKTSPESDIPDRLKLERLRNALRAQAAASSASGSNSDKS